MTTQVIGRSLGHYKVLDKIGRGGMGEVYLAEDTKLGRRVAIKMLPEELAHDAELLARFEREARVLASLNHPGIATLHGLEQSEDVRFIVMELVPGDTLEDRIRKGTLEIEEALPLFLQIAEALEAAHGKGVVHRDLKPPNIKITPDGKTKILDFGLAKPAADEPAGSNLSESPTVARETQAGVILGTVPYMSPEQARGKPVDKRTDIWAFGCVLFEALAGQRAFDGDSIADVMGAIVKTEPDWKLLPKTTPRRIRELLHRCLEKDTRRRLRDSGEAWFAIDQALTELLDPSTGDEVKEGTKALTARPFVVTAAVTALITGLTVWALMGADMSTPVTRSVIPLAPADELHFDRGSVAISADGRQIVYVGRDSRGTQQLYLRMLDQLEGRPLDSTDGARVPFFSPDGRWVVYYDGVDQTLMKVSVSGGAPVKVAAGDDYRGAREYRGASWGRDGWIVLDTISAGLLRIHEDGGTPEILTQPNLEEREKTHRLPQILPGGEAILFTLGTGDDESWNDTSIAVLSLDSGDYRVVLEGGMKARYIDTGHLVYARGGDLLAVPFDLDALEVTGPPGAVIEDVSMDIDNGQAEFAISDTGTLVYVPGGARVDNRRMWWVDRTGARELLLDEERHLDVPRLSPDGRQLALIVYGMNVSVWIHDLTRGTLSRLASGYNNQTPLWTPDGRRVAFGSDRDGPGNMYWQLADGSGPPERLVESENNQTAGSFSPDGKVLAFHETRPETRNDIMLLSLEGERKVEPFVESDFDDRSPRFSPDGRFIAYESNETGRWEIYLRPHPRGAGKWQVSTDGGRSVRWNPNGRELFYFSGNRMIVVDIAAEGELILGNPRVLFETELNTNFDVAPDGQRFVIADAGTEEVAPSELVLVQNWFEELKADGANDGQ